MHQTYQMNNCN